MTTPFAVANLQSYTKLNADSSPALVSVLAGATDDVLEIIKPCLVNFLTIRGNQNPNDMDINIYIDNVLRFSHAGSIGQNSAFGIIPFEFYRNAYYFDSSITSYKADNDNQGLHILGFEAKANVRVSITNNSGSTVGVYPAYQYFTKN